MAKSTQEKIAFEQRVVSEMIALYCKKNHTKSNELCDECAALVNYAKERKAQCPQKENDTLCLNCQTHCYRPSMRENIRVVMRYSGPRMLFHHPVLAIQHLIENNKEKKALKHSTK